VKPRASKEFHIPSLDGVRALSFLVVYVAHAGFGDLIPGGFGVTVFFFLSGYLITTLLRMEFERSGTVSLRDFYLRRALRILPPFYTVLMLALFLGFSGILPGGPPQTAPVLAQVFHFSNYWQVLHGTRGLPEGTGVYWSLAVEEHFYLLFPCIYIALQKFLPDRRRAQAAVLLVLCALILVWRCVLILGLDAIPERTYLASDTRFDSILFGCALAIGANPMLDEPRAAPAVLRWVLFPVGIALLGVSFLYRAPWFRETARYTLQGIALTPVFVVAIRQPGFLPMRLLNWKPLRHIGVLSYSLYLLHHVMLYALSEAMPGWAHFVLALALSIGTAQVIHRFIEKPCARLRHRLSHVDKPAPEPTLIPAGQ
jgi:peptidoglycan/LPS O-acetylase OafA/YrhL